MVDWTDKFDRADVDLHANLGWQVQSVSSGALEILDRLVTNTNTNGEAFAAQETTTQTPATAYQEVTAGVGCTVTAANNKVGCGLFASRALSYYGYRASIDYTAAQRVLRLERATIPAVLGTMEELATKNVTLLLDTADSDLGIIQEIRMRASVRSDGFRVQVWLNNDNMEVPDLEFLDKRDTSIEADTPSLFGDFYLWCDAGSANNVLFITSIRGRDWVEQELGANLELNGRRASELITEIQDRYTGSSTNTDFSRTQALALLRSAQQDILNALGDMAYFIHQQITFTPTISANDEFTMPTYVEKVMSFRDRDVRGRIYTPEWIGLTTEGALIFRIKIGSTTTPWKVLFKLKVDGPGQEYDKVAIPPRFDETLILGTLMRMHVVDGSRPSEYQVYRMEFDRIMEQMHAECVKMHRQNHPFKRLYSIPGNRRRAQYETDHRHRGY